MDSSVDARADSGPGTNDEFDWIVLVRALIVSERKVGQPEASERDVDFCRVERESVCSCHAESVAGGRELSRSAGHGVVTVVPIERPVCCAHINRRTR